MEQTEEGRAIAKATRDILKRKYEEVEQASLQGTEARPPNEQRAAPPKAPCTHEVAPGRGCAWWVWVQATVTAPEQLLWRQHSMAIMDSTHEGTHASPCSTRVAWTPHLCAWLAIGAAAMHIPPTPTHPTGAQAREGRIGCCSSGVQQGHQHPQQTHSPAAGRVGFSLHV